jgi:hypothetical protein
LLGELLSRGVEASQGREVTVLAVFAASVSSTTTLPAILVRVG